MIAKNLSNFINYIELFLLIKLKKLDYEMMIRQFFTLKYLMIHDLS